jgi:putative acetyltransferase
MTWIIRQEAPADGPAIEYVIAEAFGRPDEAKLVEQLRAGGWARLSLVAQRDGQIVGHVLFSELKIERGTDATAALALAPLAVLPKFQSRGVGTALVQSALDECRQAGHRIAIVLGHPAYYARFGFSAALARPLESPYAGDSFMALELVAGALAGVRGRVVYAPPFDQPW